MSGEDQLEVLARDSLAGRDSLRASAAAAASSQKSNNNSNNNNSIYGGTEEVSKSTRDDADEGGVPLLPRNSSASSSSSSSSTTSSLAKRSLVGWFLMLALSFISDTAGPYGIEDAVAAAGPGPTLLLVLVVPFIVNVPTLMCMHEVMELMPTNHGMIRWCAVGLGPFWGFVNAIFQALVNTVDVAVYPVLTQKYLFRLFFPELEKNASFGIKYAVRVAVIAVSGGQNYFSIKEQGKYSVVMAALILGPFLAGLFMGEWEPSVWTESVPEMRAGTFLSIGLWLYTGTLVSASVTEDAESVSELMKSWYYSIPLEILAYALPLLVVLSCKLNCNWAEWDSGYLVTLYKKVNGPLGVAVGIGAVLSNIALYASNVVFSVRFIWAVADIGWLPSFLTKLNRYHVPYHAVTFNIVTSLILNLLDFEFIVENEIVLTTLNQIFFVLAFIRIRQKYPDVARPYRVPCDSIFGIFLISVPKIFLYSASSGASLSSWQAVVFLVVCVVLVLVLYGVAKWQGVMAGEALDKFCALHPDHHHEHHQEKREEGTDRTSIKHNLPDAHDEDHKDDKSDDGSGSDNSDGAHHMRDDVHHHHHHQHQHHHPARRVASGTEQHLLDGDDAGAQVLRTSLDAMTQF